MMAKPQGKSSIVDFFAVSRVITCKISIALIFLLGVIPNGIAYSERFVLKIGTLAPSGSVWIDVINSFRKELGDKTGGKIKMVVYPSGVMGDESEMLRKIKQGKLHGGGFIVKAIKEMAPEMMVLDTPFIFKDYNEVNYIYDKMFPDFERIFEKHGFVLVGMTHHGFVKFFSTKKIFGFHDLRKLRTWAWHGEETIKAFLTLLGVKPVYLKVPDLISGLETGLIEAFQTSPLSCISLQWCKFVKYVLDVKYRYEPGVVVISKEFFDKLPEELKNTIKELGRKYTKKLSQEMEKLQLEAEEKLRKSGIKFVKPSHREIQELSQKTLKLFREKAKDKELFEKVIKELKEYRSKKG